MCVCRKGKWNWPQDHKRIQKASHLYYLRPKKPLGSIPIMKNNDTDGTEATQEHLGKERVISREQPLGSAGAYFSSSVKINIRDVLFGYLVLPVLLIHSLMNSSSRPLPNEGVSSASWSLLVAPSYSTRKNKPCKFVV